MQHNKQNLSTHSCRKVSRWLQLKIHLSSLDDRPSAVLIRPQGQREMINARDNYAQLENRKSLLPVLILLQTGLLSRNRNGHVKNKEYFVS